MQLFRVRIRLDAPLASPLASGMLFGQLCWALRESEGEGALATWLAEPEALWAVSDAYPQDMLPRPLLPFSPPPEDMKDADETKQLKKKGLISRAGFLKIRSRMTEPAIAAHLHDAPLREVRLARNSIDRHTGRARDEGGLFFRTEDWSPAACPERDIYVEAPPGEKARIAALFEAVGVMGYGKSQSLGRGQFAVLSVALDDELSRPPAAANRFLSLSRGVRTASMAEVRCRIEPHFGKLASRLTLGEGASPFKRPILLTRPGATFARGAEGRFGRWLTNVHPTRPEVGHNAFHVAIPYTEADHA